MSLDGGITPTAELADTIFDYRAMLGFVGNGRVRSTDEWEAESLANICVALRDVLGSPDFIVYHVCRHQEGDGDCSAAKQVL